MKNYNFVLIDKNDTKKLIDQLYEVEKTTGGIPYDYDIFEEMLFHDTNLTFACFDGKEIVGIITINLKSKKFGGCVYIVNIGVKESHHKQGIATQLINMVFDYIKNSFENKPVKIALEVDKTNIPACKLYKKLGFEFDENYLDDEQYGMTIDYSKLNASRKQ